MGTSNSYSRTFRPSCSTFPRKPKRTPDDIPERLGLAEANTVVSYRRTPIQDADVLLPVEATLAMVLTRGFEDLNRTRLTACRSYRVESAIRFAGDVTDAAPEPVTSPEAAIAALAVAAPDRSLIEIILEEQVDPSTAKLGGPVTAVVVREVRDGGVLVRQGTRVFGRLSRIDRQEMPFPVFEIGLKFDEIELGGERRPLTATMVDAGPAAGLIRQSRRLEPTFNKRRGARMDILVREMWPGQGIVHWDARRGPLPGGFKMKWRVQRDTARGH